MNLRQILKSAFFAAAAVALATAAAQSPTPAPGHAPPSSAAPPPVATRPATVPPLATPPQISPPPTLAGDLYDPTQPISATNKPKPANADSAPRIDVESARKAAGKASVGHAFLWEVKSPGNVVYLFGTIHVGKSTFYPLPPAVEQALRDSTKLVVEADISSSAGTEDLPKLMGYQAPDSLDKKIPKPLYDRLKVQLTRLNIPESAAKTMKPFIAGGLLSIVEYSRLGYDMNYGVDSYLIGKARESGKQVLELESQRAQLELMAGMPQELQEAFLDNALSTLEAGSAAEQVTGMVNAWQSGDAQLMKDVTDAVNKNMRLNDRIDEILVYGRNVAMQKKIEGYLAEHESHFVAVGSLHLIGPRGLLAGLKAKGYVVTQK